MNIYVHIKAIFFLIIRITNNETQTDDGSVRWDITEVCINLMF